MAAWIEDAQIINEVKDLHRNKLSILQRTADVDDFLSDERLASAALVAPKGFGKTLMLKLKRVSLQEQDFKCLPKRPIVDRPKDRPPILPSDTLDLMEKSENWETIWQLALCIATIKFYSDEPDVKPYLLDLEKKFDDSTLIGAILKNPLIETPFEILHSILTSNRSDLFDIMKNSSVYTSIFSRIHKNTAIFVDNIDEYLEHYINYEYARKHDLYKRYLRVWHNGQIGAWLALRRLNGTNPHIKIFISLRKEAFHYAAAREPLFANLKAFSRQLTYTREDIKLIIDNNIFGEPASNLVDKNSKSPVHAFVGIQNEVISNSGTGKLEPLIDYWLRHCTLRPRDAVEIGKEISKIKPQRRDKIALRSAINRSAADRVQILFTEVMPFFDGLIPELFPRILTSNVISAQDLAFLASKYYQIVSEEYGITSESAHHPFCALYAIGLLGVISEDRDRSGRLIQTFEPVGKVPFGSINVLPGAEKYVIHPALTDYIQTKNLGFLRKTNRQNVIGDNLEWRVEQEVRFVGIGDMRGYRASVMSKPGASQTFPAYWSETFISLTRDLDYALASGGDSVLLADRSPARLIRTIGALMNELKQSSYALPFRFGVHGGFWRLNHDEDGVAHPEISEIVGVAARIEPFARPGDILISDEAVQLSARSGWDLAKEGVKPVSQDYFETKLFDLQKGLLISKQGKEEEEWLQMHFLTVP